MGTAHVVIKDGKTGQPTAARITGQASDGKLYAPPEAYVFNARMAAGLQRIFFVNGEYTVEAPVGNLVIEAHKGFDYWPAKPEVQVKAGQSVEGTPTPKPPVDLAR